MAEELAIEPFTTSVEEDQDSFFQKLPTDLRYEKITFQKFYPTAPLINSDTISVIMPAWTSSTLYMMDQAIIKVRLKILSATGERLPDDTKVAPINNVLGSLFSHQKMYLNDQQVTANTQGVPYRHYLEKSLNYGFSSKQSWLQSGGYYSNFNYENTMDNEDTSFTKRYERFVDKIEIRTIDGTSYDSRNVNRWRDSGALFVDYLNWDLSSCPTALINGVSLKLELKLASAKQFLMTEVTGLNPTFQIADFEIIVPCAHLSNSFGLKLIERLRKEDALYHFVRRNVIPLTVPQNTPVFYADNILGEPTLPSRIIIGFVKESAYLGDYAQDPLIFQRDWSSTSWTGTPPITRVDDIKKIAKVSLNLNGSDIDALSSDSPELDYFRLAFFSDLKSGLVDNSINFDAGSRLGFPLFIFDFTNNFHGATSVVRPMIREGQVRLTVQFSKALNFNLTAVIYCERPSLIKINEKRAVECSFLV